MNKYKTFEELKEELGDKFEEYIYKANIELLIKTDKAIELIKNMKIVANYKDTTKYSKFEETDKGKELLDILQGSDKE